MDSLLERGVHIDFVECVRTRRSIRRFSDMPVEHEKFEEAVRMASYSPSWKNTQIVRYILIENRSMIKNIAENCVLDFKFNADTIEKAPAIVIVTCISGRAGFEKDGSFSTSKGDRWEMFDAGIAVQTFCLAANSIGLGTVILGIFDEEKVHKAAEIAKGQKTAAIIAIGYPGENPSMPKRKDVSELISYRI